VPSVKAISSDKPIQTQLHTAVQMTLASANRLQKFEGGVPVARREVESEKMFWNVLKSGSSVAFPPIESSSSLKL